MTLESAGEILNISQVQVVDKWKGFGVSFEFEKGSKFLRSPIETISQSEGGFERTYQGSCFVFVWSVLIPAGESFKNKITLRLEG